jgi:hypothetical protein
MAPFVWPQVQWGVPPADEDEYEEDDEDAEKSASREDSRSVPNMEEEASGKNAADDPSIEEGDAMDNPNYNASIEPEARFYDVTSADDPNITEEPWYAEDDASLHFDENV